MITFRRKAITETEPDMKSQSETEVSMTLEEFEAYNNKKQPVSAYINNAFVVWGLFFVVAAFAGNMLYSNIVEGIEGADNTANKAITLIEENQKNSLELFKKLEASVTKTATTQETTVKTLESINTIVNENKNSIFNIKSSRYTDKDALELKDRLSEEDADIQKAVDRLSIEVKNNERVLNEFRTSIQAVKSLAESNARVLGERTGFIDDMRERVGTLEDKAKQNAN